MEQHSSIYFNYSILTRQKLNQLALIRDIFLSSRTYFVFHWLLFNFDLLCYCRDKVQPPRKKAKVELKGFKEDPFVFLKQDDEHWPEIK